MWRTLQKATRFVLLAVFLGVVVTGKVRLWMGLFVVSVLAAFLFGRIYCGWLCPIHTITSAITWAKRKLGFRDARCPSLLTKGWVRYAMLGLFLAVFVFVTVSGRKLPVLPALLVLGAIVSLFYSEELWHRYLCPYGLILRLPASSASRGIAIDRSRCNNCGACERVCPARAVATAGPVREIVRNECLVCMKCVDVCRKDAISYR